MSGPMRVLVADDQDLIRGALVALLLHEPGIEVIGQARNGWEAVTEARRLRPDVVLMDVRMPGLSGPEATQRIRTTMGLESVRVLMLTTFEDAEVVQSCMAAGADGFIGKGSSPTALVDALHAVRRGESPLSPRAARAVLNRLTNQEEPAVRPPTNPRLGSLTSREIDVVRLVSGGITNEDIAQQLSISPATAKTHVRNAMKKLGTRNRAQLVATAHSLGLTAP